MDNPVNLSHQEGITKLKALAESIKVCLFCTNLKSDDGSTCRPMGMQEIDDKGTFWFFSDVHSEKNLEIKDDKHVQLFFADPGKSSYLVVNGDAEILVDKEKTDELWSPLVKTWFKKGKDDPNISIIRVKTKNAYYWDTDGNSMINLLKLVTSVVTGTNLVNSKEGAITV